MYAYRLCEALGIDPKGPDGGVVSTLVLGLTSGGSLSLVPKSH